MPELDERIRAALTERAGRFEPDRSFDVRLGRARRRRTRRRVAAAVLAAAVVVFVVAVSIPPTLSRRGGRPVNVTGIRPGQVWKVAASNEHVGSLNGSGAVAHGSLFVPVTDGPRAGRVLRLDATSLRVRAALAVPGQEVGVFGGFGSVWAVREQDPKPELRRIDPTRFRVTATIRLPISVDSIVTGAGRIWVGNGDGAVVTVDPRTGRTRPVTNPHIVGAPNRPNLTLVTIDGGVWAAGTFDASTRTQLVRLDNPATAPVLLPADRGGVVGGGNGAVFLYGLPPTPTGPGLLTILNLRSGAQRFAAVRTDWQYAITPCLHMVGRVVFFGTDVVDEAGAGVAPLPLPPTQPWTGIPPGAPLPSPHVSACTLPGPGGLYVVAHGTAVARLTGS